MDELVFFIMCSLYVVYVGSLVVACYPFYLGCKHKCMFIYVIGWVTNVHMSFDMSFKISQTISHGRVDNDNKFHNF